VSDDIRNLLRALAEQVNAQLPSALQRLGGPERLREAMAYTLLAPGKRLRPALVMLAAQAAGGEHSAARSAAVAVEMVHTYSLIHDDLPAMDDDDLRRGRPTCHRQFDEATAILAGDALLTGAFQILAEDYPPKTASLCCLELARGAGSGGMVGGQADDLAWERQRGPGAPATVADLEQVHSRKTGALFRACVRLGAIVVQGEQTGDSLSRSLSALDRFGRFFGLAFQITDDLLDVEGDAESIGKGVRKDAARGKLTYPGLIGADQSRKKAGEAIQTAMQAARELGMNGEPLVALAGYLLERRQ
jgi:geranylgeranyl diphosphate synthase type II